MLSVSRRSKEVIRKVLRMSKGSLNSDSSGRATQRARLCFRKARHWARFKRGNE
jgi:hypothetical protein